MLTLMYTHLYTGPLSLNIVPGSVVQEVGSVLLLECSADGIPFPTVTWTKDGVFLPPCSAALIGQICMDRKSVFVQFSQEEDSGVYTCQAEGGLGDSVTYTVDVSIVPRRSKLLLIIYKASKKKLCIHICIISWLIVLLFF